MSTVTVKFRPSKVPGRPGSLVYQIAHNRIVKQIASGIRINGHGENCGCAMSCLIPYREQNSITSSVIRHLEHDLLSFGSIINELDRQAGDYTTQDVIRYFQALRQTSLSVFDFMEATISKLTGMNRLGTARNYRAAMKSFRRFRKGADISLEEIDRDLMEEYQTYLKTAGLARNSVSFYMRIMRAVYNRGVSLDLTIDRRPFQNVFTGTEKTPKRAIQAADISRIRNLDLTRYPRLEFARDIFMFLFYCRGMSFVDAAFLKKTNIRYGNLTYFRRKTGQQIHVKIINCIADIIDRHISSCSEYIFPIITNIGRNERQQYETGLREVNKYLKTIGEMAGLSAQLTTYVARHTWATIAKSKNVPLNVIADALGHESTHTTQIYLAAINSSEIDNANELIIADI